ncbi:MAG: thioredoxin domain-containing protein [Elusimicrobiales bacterium]|nr:thioredoxin domain-containing protein [Elusimicrobiales bacterium]
MFIKQETIRGLCIGAGLIFLSTLIVLIVRHLDVLPHRQAPEFRTIGEDNAKIHIEEFTDFACPACAGAHKITHKLSKAFKGEIKISFKHNPLLSLHQWSIHAAVYADCAGEQEKFWDYADLLFENRNEWGYTEKMPKALKTYAKKLNLNMNKFNACVNNPETLKAVKMDMAEAKMLDINATPTFFVNKKRAVGARQLIDHVRKFEYLRKK